MSDPSALLLLKYVILCHKSSEKLHLRSNLGHKLVHGAGGLHMLVLLKLIMLMFYFLLLLMFFLLIILTIYIKFNIFTDSIMAIAEDIFTFFSVIFATNMCLQKVKRF